MACHACFLSNNGDQYYQEERETFEALEGGVKILRLHADHLHRPCGNLEQQHKYSILCEKLLMLTPKNYWTINGYFTKYFFFVVANSLFMSLESTEL